MFKALIAIDGSVHANHAIEAVAWLPRGPGGLGLGLIVDGKHGTSGSVAVEIVGLARETSADQIAMGTRGLGAAGSLFLGSVALGVVHRSHVPVLLVK